MVANDPVYDQIIALLRNAAPNFVHERNGIQALANVTRWLTVPGGCTLFKQTEPSDAIYLLLSGVLGVSIEDSAGQERMVGRLGPGEIVGEMGCITGRSRTATVRALRSSELLAISWCDLERIAMNDPAILLSICRTLVERLVQSQMGRAPGFHPHTFVLTSVGDSVDLHAFAQCFKEALTVIGETFLVRRDDCENMTAHELFQLERSHRYLIYVTEPDSPIWSKLACVRLIQLS